MYKNKKKKRNDVLRHGDSNRNWVNLAKLQSNNYTSDEKRKSYNKEHQIAIVTIAFYFYPIQQSLSASTNLIIVGRTRERKSNN